jgi:hypothetical protein
MKDPKYLLRRLMQLMVMSSLLLMLAWLAHLGARTEQLIYDNHVQESTMRSQLLAAELARSINRALDYGIPIGQLQGVDKVFEDRIGANREVAQIVLTDQQGLQLLASGVSQIQGMSVTAHIGQGGSRVGTVTVHVRPIERWDVILLPLSVAALLLALALLVLAEALRFSIRIGPWHRESVVVQALDLAAKRDYTQLVREAPLQAFDRRSTLLSVQIRDLNERFTRLFRLIRSLLETEPSDDKRNKLADLADKLQAHRLFPTGKPTVCRVAASAARQQLLVYLVVMSWAVHLFRLSMGVSLGSGQATAQVFAALLIAWACWEVSTRASRPAGSLPWQGLFGLLGMGVAPLAAFFVTSQAGSSGSVAPAMMVFENLSGLSLQEALIYSAHVAFSAIFLQSNSPNLPDEIPRYAPLTVVSAMVVGGLVAWGLPLFFGPGAELIFAFLLAVFVAGIYLPGFAKQDWGADPPPPARYVTTGRDAAAWALPAYVLAAAAPMDGAPALQASFAVATFTWVVPLLGSACGILACSWLPHAGARVMVFATLIVGGTLVFGAPGGRYAQFFASMAPLFVMTMLHWVALARFIDLGADIPTPPGKVRLRWVVAGAAAGLLVSWIGQVSHVYAAGPGVLLFVALLLLGAAPSRSKKGV